MLFDLRSRGRRRTVQAVYLGLALLMGGGLVLFGVGAGNGFGGILNAFTGNGSGGSQKQVISSAEKTALRQTCLGCAWKGLDVSRQKEQGLGSFPLLWRHKGRAGQHSSIRPSVEAANPRTSPHSVLIPTTAPQAEAKTPAIPIRKRLNHGTSE